MRTLLNASAAFLARGGEYLLMHRSS